MAVTLQIVDTLKLGVPPEPLKVPDGSAIVVRRGAHGADVLVLPSEQGAQAAAAPAKDRASIPRDDGPLADEALHVREMSLSLSSATPSLCTLEIVDGRGVRHRHRLNRADLSLLLPCGDDATAPAAVLPDLEDAHTAALARRANAEAELLEIQAETARQAPAGDDRPLVAQSWSVEQIKGADGAPAFLVHLKGDGRAMQPQLSGYLAATMCGRLGLMVSELLDEPKRGR